MGSQRQIFRQSNFNEVPWEGCQIGDLTRTGQGAGKKEVGEAVASPVPISPCQNRCEGASPVNSYHRGPNKTPLRLLPTRGIVTVMRRLFREYLGRKLLDRRR